MKFSALLAWLWLLFGCGLVRADAPELAPEALAQPEDSGSFASALRVEVISCVLEESAVDVSEMLKIARAELAPHVLVRADEKNSQPLLRVDACHDERLVLRLLSPEGPEQSIALHDVPLEHRPRVAALALAELVLTARTVGEWRAERAKVVEKPATAKAASAPAPAAPATAAPSNTPARLPDWNPPAAHAPDAPRLGLGSEARLFLQQSLSVSYGPRLFLRLPRVDLSLLGLISRRRVELGELRTGLVALNVAVNLWRSKSSIDAAVSLGAEVGVTWGRAEPRPSTDGKTKRAQAQFASAFGQVSLGGAISDQAYAHAALAAGYALGVHASVDGERAGTLGAFAGLSVGLAWLL